MHPDSSGHMGVTTCQPRPPAYKWLGIAPKWLYTKTNTHLRTGRCKGRLQRVARAHTCLCVAANIVDKRCRPARS
eukprot:15169990-Heterocapsa_arctica.AAC.1